MQANRNPATGPQVTRRRGGVDWGITLTAWRLFHSILFLSINLGDRMSIEQQPFNADFPAYWTCQVGFRIPVLNKTVWINVTRKWFRHRIAAFAVSGTSTNDLLIGLAHSNGAWVLRSERLFYRIKSF